MHRKLIGQAVACKATYGGFDSHSRFHAEGMGNWSPSGLENRRTFGAQRFESSTLRHHSLYTLSMATFTRIETNDGTFIAVDEATMRALVHAAQEVARNMEVSEGDGAALDACAAELNA